MPVDRQRLGELVNQFDENVREYELGPHALEIAEAAIPLLDRIRPDDSLDKNVYKCVRDEITCASLTIPQQLELHNLVLTDLAEIWIPPDHFDMGTSYSVREGLVTERQKVKRFIETVRRAPMQPLAAAGAAMLKAKLLEGYGDSVIGKIKSFSVAKPNANRDVFVKRLEPSFIPMSPYPVISDDSWGEKEKVTPPSKTYRVEVKNDGFKGTHFKGTATRVLGSSGYDQFAKVEFMIRGGGTVVCSVDASGYFCLEADGTVVRGTISSIDHDKEVVNVYLTDWQELMLWPNEKSTKETAAVAMKPSVMELGKAYTYFEESIMKGFGVPESFSMGAAIDRLKFCNICGGSNSNDPLGSRNCSCIKGIPFGEGEQNGE